MNLAAICVRRPVFATMLIMFLVVLGIVSFRGLGVDLFPKSDPPIVSINVTLRGASPEEMVSQVVLPLEDQVSAVNGLEEMEAMVFEGGARISCRFVLDRNIIDAAQDVREKVALAMRRLPPNVEPPIITKADPDQDPILTIAIGGPRPLQEITEIADKQVKRYLQTVDGVASVDLVGGRSREIHILLDAEKLSAHRITVNQVAAALQRENLESPGGRLFQGSSELAVRTMGRFDALNQFERLVVANRDAARIRVADLGHAEDAFQEPRSLSLLDGEPGVTLQVRRQTGTNTVKIADEVRRQMDKLRQRLPRDLTVQIVSDQSAFIRASVSALEEHLLIGGLFAAFVVFLFIRNWRAVLISSVAIPTSIISTFTIMKMFDFTLNNMTLLALTLAVGIVIDDAIVVLENIFRHVEELGSPPFRAAIEGTREISLAVMATTLSLVIIFVPIAFMQGYAQKFLYSFGLTMTFAILVSLLVSFTLTPMLSARFLGLERGPALSKQTRFFSWIERHYERLLRWSLDHPRAVLTASLLVLASIVPLNRMVGRDWIPADDQGEFTFHVDLPEGTSYAGAMEFVGQVEKKMRALPAVEHLLVTSMGRPSHVHLSFELKDLDERTLSSAQVADLARGVLDTIPRIQFKPSFPSALGGGEGTFGFPLQGQLTGPDFDKLGDYSKELAEEIKRIPGVIDALPALFLSNPELRVTVNRERAADLGVSTSDIASVVRLLMSGEDEISYYREAGEQYPVKILIEQSQREDRDIMARLMVPSRQMGQVRLDSVAEITRGLGPSRIGRFNRQFNVRLDVNNDKSLPLNEAAEKMSEIVRKANLPPGYGFRFTGVVKAMDATTGSLVMAFLLATVFMYMVLAAQFESLKHPFIIMLALPMSVPFALLSLYVTGRTLNLWSALGVLLLLGIVKKNAILQIDCANRLRAEGTELREALIEADRARLRPILMTTFSIIAGLIPTAFGSGAGSAQRSAIAVTIIGGQMLCLLLTLILTPVAYELIETWRPGLLWLRRRRTAPLPATAGEDS